MTTRSSLLICWVTSLWSPRPGGGELHGQALLPRPVKSSLGSKCWASGGVLPSHSCLTNLARTLPSTCSLLSSPLPLHGRLVQELSLDFTPGPASLSPTPAIPLTWLPKCFPCSALCDDQAARGEGCFLVHRGVTITILLLSISQDFGPDGRPGSPPALENKFLELQSTSR